MPTTWSKITQLVVQRSDNRPASPLERGNKRKNTEPKSKSYKELGSTNLKWSWMTSDTTASQTLQLMETEKQKAHEGGNGHDQRVDIEVIINEMRDRVMRRWSNEVE